MRRGGAKSILKILNGIIVGSEKKQLEIFIIETNGSSHKVRENSSYGEDGVKRRVIQVCTMSKQGRPMKQVTSRNVVGVSLHINAEVEVGERGQSSCLPRNPIFNSSLKESLLVPVHSPYKNLKTAAREDGESGMLEKIY